MVVVVINGTDEVDFNEVPSYLDIEPDFDIVFEAGKRA